MIVWSGSCVYVVKTLISSSFRMGPVEDKNKIAAEGASVEVDAKKGAGSSVNSNVRDGVEEASCFKTAIDVGMESWR